MMKLLTLSCMYMLLFVTEKCIGVSSPLKTFATYNHATELQANTADLWWTVNNFQQEITFELHVKTTGWVSLGISPGGGMKDADMAIGWIDSSGRVHLQDRFSVDKVKPVVDNTTQDWLVLHGQEKDGWTAISFKRKLDSCDSMDVPIKPGTNIVIFAYGLEDPDLCHSKTDITYHSERRGTRILPLLSYADPPSDAMLTGLEYIDLQLNNTVIPSVDTTYYCKVFKVPRESNNKRHAIAHKVLVDPRNPTFVHHLDLFECGTNEVLDDAKLPDGVCDEIFNGMRVCASVIATSWAVGGDLITVYPKETGYPVTDGIRDKYYMIKIHYDNPHETSGQRDSSGVRFYLGNELRPNDLGYFILGASSTPTSLAIPPKTKQFFVDSYCPPEATENLPSTGINVLSALPHTHLQGISVWTKLIRNNQVTEYLFNGESFNFNYQFENRLEKPIKIYPGDSFLTRCVYSTTDKETITLGGQRTIDEMCSNTFSYYPLVNTLRACMTTIKETEWATFMSNTTQYNSTVFKDWLHNLTWNPTLVTQWQTFYNKAVRTTNVVRQGSPISVTIPVFEGYQDIAPVICNKTNNYNISKDVCIHSKGSVAAPYILFIISLIICVL